MALIILCWEIGHLKLARILCLIYKLKFYDLIEAIEIVFVGFLPSRFVGLEGLTLHPTCCKTQT